MTLAPHTPLTRFPLRKRGRPSEETIRSDSDEVYLKALPQLGKVSDVQIAEELGVSVRYPRAWRSELGIPPAPVSRSRARNPTRSWVLAMTKEGMSQIRIAEELGVTKQAVLHHVRALRASGELPPRGPK